MTPAERHRRLAEIITVQDELAAAFMRLDWMVRDLARAEFCEPRRFDNTPIAAAPPPIAAAAAPAATPLPRIRRAK